MARRDNNQPDIIETDYTEFIAVPHTEELVEFSWLQWILWYVICPLLSLLAVGVIVTITVWLFQAYNDQGKTTPSYRPSEETSVTTTNKSGTSSQVQFDENSSRRFIGHKKLVNALAFSSDGKYLLSGEGDIHYRQSEDDNFSGSQRASTDSNSYLLYVWNYKLGKLERMLNEHKNPIIAVAYSLDGEKAASADIQGTFFVWDTATWTVIDRFDRKSRINSGLEKIISFNCLAFSPDGKTLAAGGSALPSNSTGDETFGRKASVVLWDLKQHKEILQDSNLVAIRPYYDFNNQVDCVFSLSYTRLGKLLVAGVSGSNSGIYILDKTGKISPVLDAATSRSSVSTNIPMYSSGHDSPSSSYVKAALKFDDHRIVAGDNQGRVSLWEFQPDLNESDRTLAMDLTKPLDNMDKNIRDIKYSLDGKYLASCGEEITIRDGNADKLQILGFLSPVAESAYRDRPYYGHCIAFTPDGQSIAVGCSDKVIRIWDFKRFSTTLRHVTPVERENMLKENSTEKIDMPEELDFRTPRKKI